MNVGWNDSRGGSVYNHQTVEIVTRARNSSVRYKTAVIETKYDIRVSDGGVFAVSNSYRCCPSAGTTTTANREFA